MKKFLLLLSVLFVVSCSSEEDTAPEKYTLTVNINPSDGGSVNPNGGTVSAGEQITLTQTPNNNFVFKDWSGSASGNANPYIIIMDANKTVNANYTKQIIIESNGTIKCPDSKVGYKETINGKEYEVVDKNSLINLIKTEKDVTCVCTTLIRNMDNLFEEEGNYRKSFNQYINNWDTSNVLRMVKMFAYASVFNKDISSWDVSNVRRMDGMFFRATAFNQDIGNWDVGNVVSMSSLFGGTHSFNQDIGNWDVSSVSTMQQMFIYAREFNQDISKWDVSNVILMNGMFLEAYAFNQDIGNWDVSNVIDMSTMFGGRGDNSSITQPDQEYYFSNFNQDISNWDVSKVTNMLHMFTHNNTFNQDIGNWNTAAVTDMSNMFNGALEFNQDIGDWDVSNVNSMVLMFGWAKKFNQDLNKWCVTNITEEPFYFAKQGVLKKDNFPKWGTCPSG